MYILDIAEGEFQPYGPDADDMPAEIPQADDNGAPGDEFDDDDNGAPGDEFDDDDDDISDQGKNK